MELSVLRSLYSHGYLWCRWLSQVLISPCFPVRLHRNQRFTSQFYLGFCFPPVLSCKVIELCAQGVREVISFQSLRQGTGNWGRDTVSFVIRQNTEMDNQFMCETVSFCFRSLSCPPWRQAKGRPSHMSYLVPVWLSLMLKPHIQQNRPVPRLSKIGYKERVFYSSWYLFYKPIFLDNSYFTFKKLNITIFSLFKFFMSQNLYY